MPSEVQADNRGGELRQPFGVMLDGQTHLAEPGSDARLLLRELNHRINNELTSAICMIEIATSQSKNYRVKEALIEVEERLRAYAEVNRALQMPKYVTAVDVAGYLKQLCRAISRSKLDIRGIELLFVERPLLMSCDRSWRLGLIVSELITNSARHAFGDKGGSIQVELVPSPIVVECRVTDNGVSEEYPEPGRGCLIVEELVRSLGGIITQRFGCSGSESIVRIPVNSEMVRGCSRLSDVSPYTRRAPPHDYVSGEMNQT